MQAGAQVWPAVTQVGVSEDGGLQHTRIGLPQESPRDPAEPQVSSRRLHTPPAAVQGLVSPLPLSGGIQQRSGSAHTGSSLIVPSVQLSAMEQNPAPP